MKILLTMALCLAITTAGIAQKVKKAPSKAATKVDSINTPPRMDGNTGQYDTVRKMPGSNTPPTNQRVEYNYKIGSDSIGVHRK